MKLKVVSGARACGFIRNRSFLKSDPADSDTCGKKDPDAIANECRISEAAIGVKYRAESI